MRARAVESGIPGVILPGWQMSCLRQLSRMPLPQRVAWELEPLQVFDGPFWTPTREEIQDALVAFREHLHKDLHVLDANFLKASIEDGHASCLAFLHEWELRTGHPGIDWSEKGEWTEIRSGCTALNVLLRFWKYRAQYIGIHYDGRNVIYINGYCRPDIAPFEHFIPYDVIDGGTCYFGIFYDPDTDSIARFAVNPSGG